MWLYGSIHVLFVLALYTSVHATDISKRPHCCSIAKKGVDYVDAIDLGVRFCQLQLDGAAYGTALNFTGTFMLYAFLKYTYDEDTGIATKGRTRSCFYRDLL
jgi:hypothetical protein